MIARFLETRLVFHELAEQFQLESLNQMDQALLSEIHSVFETVAGAIQQSEGVFVYSYPERRKVCNIINCVANAEIHPRQAQAFREFNTGVHHFFTTLD